MEDTTATKKIGTETETELAPASITPGPAAAQKDAQVVPEDVVPTTTVEAGAAATTATNVNTTNKEEDDAWQRALAAVVPACVVLKTTTPFAYDTDAAGSSHASGFVVDAKRGLILTNRHVVTPGPVVAEAIFQNHEEVDIAALYRDPVHDFGFYRFDPSDATFMAKNGVSEVTLDEHGARVGMDVRIIGNDSGEKLSIASATLARLDRDAPIYGKNHYNDFNTFYFQAASGTKGGSSGSPVVDRRGVAVAINAGSRVKSSSAFFLPLHAVVRALKLLQSAYDVAKASFNGEVVGTAAIWNRVDPGAAVPRGAIQATLLYKGFDECRRLGLTPDSEKAVRERRASGARTLPASPAGSKRKRDSTVGEENDKASAPITQTEHGLLVVDTVTPDGPAMRGGLQVGDVVLSIAGRPCDSFVDLERELDAASENHLTIPVTVERGGKSTTANVTPGDLQEATLPRFVFRYGGGVLHPLGYQTARNHHETCGIAYVADPGHALGRQGVPRHAILVSVHGCRVGSTMDVARLLCKFSAEGVEKVPVMYFHIDDASRRLKTVPVRLGDQWYGPPRFWYRDDARGVWCPFEQGVDWQRMVDMDEAAFAKECSSMNPMYASAWRAMRRDAATSAARLSVAAATKTTAKASETEKEVEAKAAMEVDNNGTPKPEDDSLANGAVDGTEPWDGAPPSESSLPPMAAPPPASGADGGTAVDISASAHDTAVRVFPSLCLISADVPSVALLDGVHSKSFEGAGVIICHDVKGDVGLILTDRNTVTVSTSDVSVSFAAYPSECVGAACFFHPTHNFAMVRYRPSALSEAARSAVKAVETSSATLHRGMEVVLVGLSSSLQPVSRKCHVTNAHAAVVTHLCDVPRYRSMHEEVVELDNDFGSGFSGALTDKDGQLLALYASFSKQVKGEEHEFVRGIPVHAFQRWCTDITQRCFTDNAITDDASAGSRGVPACPPVPYVPLLDCELAPLSLSRASELGLPSEWISALARVDSERRQVLRVRSTFTGAGGTKSTLLEEGDFVVSANGQVITNCNELDDLLLPDGNTSLLPTSAQSSTALNAGSLPPLVLGVYRNGKPVQVRLPPTLESGAGTSRHLLWAGAQLQEPHRGVRELGYSPYSDDSEEGPGVYVSRWHTGSPAHRYGLYALHWVTHVNDMPVRSLDGFLQAVAGTDWRTRDPNDDEKKDGARWVRLRVVHLKRKPKVITVKLDLRYWPTTFFERDAQTGRWNRTVIQGTV